MGIEGSNSVEGQRHEIGAKYVTSAIPQSDLWFIPALTLVYTMTSNINQGYVLRNK